MTVDWQLRLLVEADDTDERMHCNERQMSSIQWEPVTPAEQSVSVTICRRSTRFQRREQDQRSADRNLESSSVPVHDRLLSGVQGWHSSCSSVALVRLIFTCVKYGGFLLRQKDQS